MRNIVRNVVFYLDPNNASSPDGYPDMFFKLAGILSA